MDKVLTKYFKKCYWSPPQGFCILMYGYEFFEFPSLDCIPQYGNTSWLSWKGKKQFSTNIKINLTKIHFYNFHLPAISDHTKNVEFYITFTICSSNRCWMQTCTLNAFMLYKCFHANIQALSYCQKFCGVRKIPGGFKIAFLPFLPTKIFLDKYLNLK